VQEPFKARPDRNAQWNRGAYLVRSLGHCGACHTPRGLAYQEKGYSEASPDYLTGAVVDNWFAGNLTGNQASGLGRWTENEISAFLRTGHNGHTVAFGSMVLVIENSTQHLSEEDLNAIAHYLKSLPTKKGETSYKPHAQQTEIVLAKTATGPFEPPGAGLYSGFCAKCHEKSGLGEAPKIPRLAGSPMVLSQNTTSLIRLVLEGGKGPATRLGPKPKKMPGYAAEFTDREIADVLTFIRKNWGNRAPAVTARDVFLLRRELQESIKNDKTNAK
jgi:mono/diheme cytochrome c family protein